MLAALSRAVEALVLPLREHAVPQGHRYQQEGSCCHTQTYRLFTYEKYHRGLIRPGACICLAYLLLLLRDMKGFSQRFVTCLLAGMAVCVITLIFSHTKISTKMEHAWVRHLVIAFSLGKVVLTSLMALSMAPPGKSVIHVCSRWLDTFTNLGVTVPALAMADWTTGAWLLYVCLHLVATTPFFIKWLDYSAAFAVFKVVFTQGLCFATYALMERSKYLTYLKQQQQMQQKKLNSSDDVPSLAGISMSHSTAPLRQSAPAPLRQSVSAPPSHSAPAPAPEHITLASGQKSGGVQEICQPDPETTYVSCFKMKKVMVKVHCAIEPELLTTEGTLLLSSFMNASLPNYSMVESAVRYGCVVLSVELCEPTRLANKPCLHSSASTEHEVASRVAGSMLKWLHASDAQRLTDGAIVLVQVNNFTFKGCWDASTNAVQLLEEVHALASIDQYSIVLSEPAVLLPAPQPKQQYHAGQLGVNVSFTACVSLPPAARLEGWQDKGERGHAAEEDGQEKSDRLLLLAHTRGMFLPLEVAEISTAANGDRTVQVCVTLPDSLLVPGQSLRLKLELIRGNTLLSTCSLLLLDSQLSTGLQELQRWAARDATPAQVSTFVEDLAEYLSFQGLCASAPSSSVTDSSVSCVSSDKMAELPEEGLLPALRAEARRSEMLHMMTEVGLELLQHAVSWGMAALAHQLLTGLMAEPLCVPFEDLACGTLPHAHSCEKDGTQQQQHMVQQAQAALAKQGQPLMAFTEVVADGDTLSGESVQGLDGAHSATHSSSLSSRTLITCALLSYNKQCLAHVLEWGRMYGGPCSYAWPWSAVDASGYSPLQILQRLPAGHVVLDQLLADPTARPAALHAQALTQRMAKGPAQKKQASASPIPSQSDLHTMHSAGSVDASVRQEGARAEGNAQSATDQSQGEKGPTAVRHRTANQQQAPAQNTPPQKCAFVQQAPARNTPDTFPQKCAVPQSELRAALKAVVVGFGKDRDIKEADYRSWCRAETAGFTNVWSCLVLVIFSYSVAQCIWKGLLLNAALLSLYPIPLSLALFASTHKKRQMFLTVGKAIYWSLMLIFGMGLLPSILAQKLAVLHLDWAVEVLMYRLMDQVQLRALLLERAISCVSKTHMYARLGLSYPLGRALALNLCSFLVGLALDMRNRRIFLKIRAVSAARQYGSQGKGAKVQ
ncbi:hypothetical protein DUNSADRAFT_11976 [Dunaliella salina]|uniref:Uncharacterized protein n=1 Tax=Dunaliella salina TaxID=3046 RepID=A0ABQ7GC92_DUNSA|nr:hypothetical protein DUNSADRAFT_11976 [Dunaliella salina]|eukprot:KAF5832219.1 hypothetical protein DUNSADRAFT_11976 [Dunaliella salina]